MAFSIQQITSYIGFVFSFIINTILMYMIRNRTTKQLGSYVYLMMSFSIFELIFSTVDVLNQPMIFVDDGEFLFFSPNPLHLNIFIAEQFNLINFACSGIIISLLAIHFFYRYMAVCNNQKWLRQFEMPRFFIWILIFLIFGLEWYLATLWLGKSQNPNCEVNMDRIIENFDVDSKHTVFIGFKYHSMTSFETIICTRSVILAVILLKIVLVSCIIVIFCGIKIWREITIKKRAISRKTLEIQRQFFRALVVQTLIPFFLLYLPLLAMLFAPIFMAELAKIDIVIQFAFVFYPILDPIAVLVIVRDYRKAIKVFFGDWIWRQLMRRFTPYIAQEHHEVRPAATPPTITQPRFIY